MLDETLVPTHAENLELVAEALAGLTQEQKTLPPKLFYDDEGCLLFQRITELPEYYLTRTELALLASIAPQIAAAVPSGAVLVEYGASDEGKADFLLRECDTAGGPVFAAYMPVDVAPRGLEAARNRLQQRYPDLLVHTLVADFFQPVNLPAKFAGFPRLGFFPGSTIGNFDPADAVTFLRMTRDTLGDNAMMLVGFDVRKDADVLIPAYDDAQGVTAAFNLNILARLNREAGADFDLDAFRHLARWNDCKSRIEMHLVSLCDQTVLIAGRTIDFSEGESIHTENSYKHRIEDFGAMATAAGWQIAESWNDRDGSFALQLLSAAPST